MLATRKCLPYGWSPVPGRRGPSQRKVTAKERAPLCSRRIGKTQCTTVSNNYNNVYIKRSAIEKSPKRIAVTRPRVNSKPCSPQNPIPRGTALLCFALSGKYRLCFVPVTLREIE